MKLYEVIENVGDPNVETRWVTSKGVYKHKADAIKRKKYLNSINIVDKDDWFKLSYYVKECGPEDII